MKNFKNFGLLLLLVAVLQACNTGSYKAAKIENKSDSICYYLGLSVGRQLTDIEMKDINPELFAKGVNDAINKDTTLSEEFVSSFVQKSMQELYREKVMKNKDKGEAFLAENEKKEGVQVTASGLQYKVITEGTGKTPMLSDHVKVHYKGTFIDGKKFDSSYDRNEPTEFPVQGVIPGFTEGLQLMKEGGKYELFIPYNLAYGVQGVRGVIDPYSALIFEIELLEVIPQPANEKGSN
jgi:FKBP-type peptidyl-prolyl cis-trans isomerase FklB